MKTFSVGFEEASFDELDRARLVAERYGTEHHEIVLRPDAVELLPEAGRGLRRALRRLLGAADLPRLRAGRRRGQGRPLGRGRRRALRRLLHLRRRSAGAARRPARRARGAAGRDAAELRRQGQLRLQSEALRARRRPAAAGAPPRLEGDLLAADAGLAAGRPRSRLGPGRRLPRALRGDRRRRAAGPPAGRRPRHLPGRRPAGQDRPLEHGALAGAARPLPRQRGRRDGARPGDAAQGARPGQEAAAAPGAGAAAAEGGPARAEAGLLDPGRRLAARAAAGVRARSALGRDAVAPGLARPRHRHRPARRATAPAARTSAASSGD